VISFAHVTRKNIKKKKLKQTNASAHLIVYRFEIHSSKGIFGVIIAFADTENVDFDILHAILLTSWIMLVVA